MGSLQHPGQVDIGLLLQEDIHSMEVRTQTMAEHTQPEVVHNPLEEERTQLRVYCTQRKAENIQ